MKREKIAFIITKSEIGGAQTWVYELKKTLDDNYDIYLIVSETGWLSKKFPNQNIKIIPEIGKLTSITASIKIAKYLKQKSINIVFSNSANAGIHSRISKLFYNHKHIYVSHGWSCIYNGGKLKSLFCFIERALSFLSNSILCVSNKDSESALKIIKIKPQKIRVIRNCITPLEKKNSINKRKKFLFVGRLTHPKRPDLFLDAARKTPNSDFYIVGDGPEKNRLEAQYSTLDNVFFLGEINNFNDYLNYDIFILSSDSEGLPMSALEAASAGLPIILSNVGGCNELIITENNNSNGFTFNNTVQDLEKKINSLLTNYEYYYSYANKVSSQFDIANAKDKYLNIIKE